MFLLGYISVVMNMNMMMMTTTMMMMVIMVFVTNIQKM
jgi:hypothetical protein